MSATPGGGTTKTLPVPRRSENLPDGHSRYACASATPAKCTPFDGSSRSENGERSARVTFTSNRCVGWVFDPSGLIEYWNLASPPKNFDPAFHTSQPCSFHWSAP